MSNKLLQIADNFWNIRGSFKIAGLIDIGTQASLVRLASGKFVFLDSYTLDGAVLREVSRLTNDGKDVVAVLNLHPFHTIHVTWMHKHFPDARHYGTARHLSRFPELVWQPALIEDPKTQAKFAADFEFSVPRGVDFISDDENLHFSSVLVLHRDSQTLHVDDTLMYIRLPLLLRFFGLPNSFSFHPTLAKVLEKRGGAAQDFRNWGNELAENWQDTRTLCAAHTATLVTGEGDPPIHDRILAALEKVESTLQTHERKYG
ncbi:hypothetical protein ACFL1J_04935 [Pseudomonadota bacterium]